MTKDEARDECLRRWRALPEAERSTIDQAQVFAAGLAEQLDFRTMGNERKVIAAWLVRELEAADPDDGNAVNNRASRRADDSGESNRQEAVQS